MNSFLFPNFLSLDIIFLNNKKSGMRKISDQEEKSKCSEVSRITALVSHSE